MMRDEFMRTNLMRLRHALAAKLFGQEIPADMIEVYSSLDEYLEYAFVCGYDLAQAERDPGKL